jgi:hypothetical protein
MLATRTPLTSEEAAWWPARVLPRVSQHWGALPTPGAPRTDGDVTVWPLLAASAVPAGASEALCAALTADDPRVACAHDTTPWRGAARDRVVLGWRAQPGEVPVSAVQPLRALARVGAGLCVVRVQRTEATLDVTVQAADAAGVGAALAGLVVSPGLRTLLVVRVEPRGDGVEALLSWPVRVQGEAEAVPSLGDAPWPARCGGVARMGEDAPRGTVPVPVLRVDGAQGGGAFLRVGRAVWGAAVGDAVAGWTLRAVTARGVALQGPGQPRPRVIPFRPL